MLASTPEEMVDSVLGKLDVDATMNMTSSSTLRRGPFAVFSTQAGDDIRPDSSLTRRAPPESFSNDWNYFPFDVDADQLPTSPIIFINDDMEALFTEPSSANLALPFPVLNTVEPLPPPSPTRLMFPLQTSSDVADTSLSTLTYLLANYKSSVIRMLSFSQLEEHSPWSALYLPKIFECFAEITIFGDSSQHAKVACLFAILAISAYNLENLGTSPIISGNSNLGNTFRSRAKLRLQRCLREQMSETKSVDYKGILMAFLAAVTMSVSQTFHLLRYHAIHFATSILSTA